jgi:Glycosyl hydrolases family 2, sugar binding domain
VLLRDCWAETRDIQVRAGWNTVQLKLGPSFESQTAFMFRLLDESGATLRDVVYTREQTPVAASEPRSKRLAVAIPPGAVSLEVPAFRLIIEGQAMSASPKASVLLPANARACDFEVESGDEPERSVAFRSGTVPFTLQCWTDSALAHYSGTALYETDFQMPRDARGKNLALDLGAVGLAAEAWVNGKKVGERAWRPFWFDISKAVRARNNTLRIRVANSNAGWEAQGGTIYGKGSWGLKYNTERDRLATLHPNGLEGPVEIMLGD